MVDIRRIDGNNNGLEIILWSLEGVETKIGRNSKWKKWVTANK